MQYSKFDGFSSVEALVHKAKEHGMSAVGITDHGTVAGIIAFLKECRKPRSAFDEKKTKKWKGQYDSGIKPVLGMEAYMSRDHTLRTAKDQPEKKKGNRHMNVIAKNFVGYQNLCRLSHTASMEGYFYDPRIDWDLLERHHEGLIVTSACLSNIINYKLTVEKFDEAAEIAGGFKSLFGDDFYLEMMYHGIDKEGKILPEIQRLGEHVGVKVIITNDCHYVNKDDAYPQKVLMCMNTGTCIRDPKRLSFPYDEFYFKSQAEMYQLFKTVPKYMTNTLELAEKCDYSDLLFVEDGGAMRLPKFDLPDGEKNPFTYLTKLAHAGAKKIGWDKSPPHMEQLNKELSDIKLIYDTKRYDFATYFLVVEDMVRYARSKGIASGIRGSGYGSVLLHCLGLCRGADPIEHHLMWERFLLFDDAYFVSENDFGISDKADVVTDDSVNVDKSDASEVMTERYH